MLEDKKHQAWLKFVRDVTGVPSGLSKDDLFMFRNLAHQDHPALIPLIDEYIRLAERSDTPVTRYPASTRASNKHLFDLLREKKFFPQNLDLAKFAARVVPGMRAYRFDKMSRSDIAGRIIEYIEDSDPRARFALERSMREALAEMSGRKPKENERRSFLSKWERIIKGLEL